MTYGEGAAHPYEYIKTITFIDGQRVQLDKLFVSNCEYLSRLSHHCYDKLLTQEFVEIDKLKQGTKPISTNYKTWYLNKKGLVIVFRPSQITPYESGSEVNILVPLATLKSWLCTNKKLLEAIYP